MTRANPGQSIRSIEHRSDIVSQPRMIETTEALNALPPECLLRGSGKGYDREYVVTVDLGDGELMFYATDTPGELEAEEVIEYHGPLTLLHCPTPTETGATA